MLEFQAGQNPRILVIQKIVRLELRCAGSNQRDTMFDNCRLTSALNRGLEISDKAVGVFNGCVQIYFYVFIGLYVTDQIL